MQMVEMDYMILHRLGRCHDITDIICVLWNFDAKRILNRTQ